ncbi:hypothetical protein ACFL35_03160 [Candidatus Riflebacteria bacterium]
MDDLFLGNQILKAVKKALLQEGSRDLSVNDALLIIFTDIIEEEILKEYISWLVNTGYPCIIYLSPGFARKYGFRTLSPLLGKAIHRVFLDDEIPGKDLLQRVKMLIYPSFTLRNLSESMLGLGCSFQQKILEDILTLHNNNDFPIYCDDYYLKRASQLPARLIELYTDYQKGLEKIGFNFSTLDEIKKAFSRQIFSGTSSRTNLLKHPHTGRKNVLTRIDIEILREQFGNSLVIPENSLLTDIAREYCVENQIELVWLKS